MLHFEYDLILQGTKTIGLKGLRRRNFEYDLILQGTKTTNKPPPFAEGVWGWVNPTSASQAKSATANKHGNNLLS